MSKCTACHGTFENEQFSRCQVFPKYYLQRLTAMVDRRNNGNFYGSFHSKFLCTMGPKSFWIRILIFVKMRHQSLLVIKCLGKKQLQLQKPFEPIVSSLTKPYFIFHIPVWLATTLWFWNSNKRINKEIFHICD